MKRILKKLLIIILIILILNNFLITPNVYAVDELGDSIAGLFAGVIGILTIIYRVPVVMIGWLINRFMAALAFAENTDQTTSGILSIFDILFTRVKILEINFFEFSNGGDSLVDQFRINVAAWFYIIRNVSAAILLVILIYIGIRMAISTIASDRAIYKRMLVDWAASLGLIFILNYIIIFVIEVNNAIVNALAESLGDGSELTATMNAFADKGMELFGGVPSIVCTIIFVMLIWQTAALFFSYFNRMLKVAFLIIISPLISLTYSIDKIGDGKAQALEAWLKEFVYTILIQPFHCAIYMSLISTAFDALIDLGGFSELSKTLGVGIFSIVCVIFTREAEKILRKIFGFKDDNNSTSLVAGAAVASIAMSKAKSAGKGTVKAFNGAKDFLGKASISSTLTNLKAEGIAAARYLSKNNTDKDGNVKKDYADLRSEERAKAYQKKAEDWEKKYMHAKDGENESKKFLTDIQKSQEFIEEKAKIEAESGETMSKDELNAVARFNVAKRIRDSNAKNPYAITKRTITRATSGIHKAKVKAIQAVNSVNPFENTTRFLASEGIQGGAAMFAGAGTLGLKGSPAVAAAAAVGTGKAIGEYTKGRKSAFKSNINELVEQHSDITPKSTVRGDKTKLLNKISGSSTDYNLDGDTIPNKLKSIIDEIQAAAKAAGGKELEESEIVTTIKENKTNPSGGLEKLYEKMEIPESGAGSDKLMRLNNAKTALTNYGVEYAISSTFAEANGVSVSSADLITSIEDDDHIIYSKEDKEYRDGQIRNLKIIKESLDNPNSTTVQQEVNKIPIEELEDFYEAYERISEIGQESVKRIKIDESDLGEDTTELGVMRAKLKNEANNLERKRALLIGNAIRDIDAKNAEAVEALINKVTADINKILKSDTASTGASSTEKTQLEAIKSDLDKKMTELEKLKKENS